MQSPPSFPSLAAALLVVAAAARGTAAGAQWTLLRSETTASLRGLSVVDARVAWASGTGGTVVHTSDGGATWQVDTIAGAAAMDLRAIHARDGRVAHVAATAGRIWRTTDGGRNWSLRYQASDSSVFLDAIDFWDDRHGIALGDPVGGRFLILLTDDGGERWREALPASRPAAEPGEAAFAASGSSLVVFGRDHALLGTGGAVARVHRTTDRGRTWIVSATPMIQGGASRGIFSVAVPAEGRVIVVGGDYARPDTVRANAAYGDAAGRFELGSGTPPRGYRSGVAIWSRGDRPALVIAVGPTGSDISLDHGGHWAALDGPGFHAVRASRDGIFYASGSGGRLARLDARSLPHADPSR